MSAESVLPLSISLPHWLDESCFGEMVVLSITVLIVKLLFKLLESNCFELSDRC